MTVSTTIDSTRGVVTTNVADGTTSVLTLSTDVLLSSVASLLLKSSTVTAEGTLQSDALQLSGDYTLYLLGAAGANTGVKLPSAPTLGQVVLILNTTANAKRVYPATGGFIGSSAVNVHITLAAMVAGTSRGGCILVCSDATSGATKWHHFAVA